MLPLFPVPVVELDGKRPHRALPRHPPSYDCHHGRMGNERTKWNLQFQIQRIPRLSRISDTRIRTCPFLFHADYAFTKAEDGDDQGFVCRSVTVLSNYPIVPSIFGGLVRFWRRYVRINRNNWQISVAENGVSGNWWRSSISLCLHFSNKLLTTN